MVKLEKLGDFLSYNDYDVIGIDESQFFSDLVEIVKMLVDEAKKIVVVAGLNSDFRRRDFGKTIQLISSADDVRVLKATCSVCKEKSIIKDAIFSHKLNGGDKIVEVGGEEMYVPVCRNCYNELNPISD
jgi:thymidine kinase